MTQQQLDLLQIATGPPAQLRTGPPQVVGRELAELGLPGIADHQPPNDLFVQDAGSLHHAGLGDGPKETALGDPRRGGPSIDPGLDPSRHGNGPDAAALAQEIREHPAGPPLLQVFAFETQKLCATEAAADEQGEDSAIAFAGQGLWIGGIKEVVGLLFGQPVPHPGTMAGNAGYPAHGSRHCRIEQTVVGHLAGESTDRGQAQVDRGGTETLFEQMRPVLSYHCLRESRRRSGASNKAEKAYQPGAVASSGVLGGDDIEHEADQAGFRGLFRAVLYRKRDFLVHCNNAPR